MNTKQGNQDHTPRSRTDGSSSRYFTVLEFYVLIPCRRDLFISDIKTVSKVKFLL